MTDDRGEGGIDPALRDQYCFGCGRHNPLGFHLEFERDGGDVVASYTPRREDSGYPGLMHGGLATLLLDEAMGWAMYVDRVVEASGLFLRMDAEAEAQALEVMRREFGTTLD